MKRLLIFDLWLKNPIKRRFQSTIRNQQSAMKDQSSMRLVIGA